MQKVSQTIGTKNNLSSTSKRRTDRVGFEVWDTRPTPRPYDSHAKTTGSPGFLLRNSYYITIIKIFTNLVLFCWFASNIEPTITQRNARGGRWSWNKIYEHVWKSRGTLCVACKQRRHSVLPLFHTGSRNVRIYISRFNFAITLQRSLRALRMHKSTK